MHLCARSSAQVGAPVLQGRRPTFLASLGTQARMLGVQIRLHSEVVQYWDSDDEPAVVLVSGEVVKGDVRPPSLRSRPLGARTLSDAFPLCAQVVIVADGVHSTARGLLASTARPTLTQKRTGYSIHRGVMTSEDIAADPVCARASLFLALLPSPFPELTMACNRPARRQHPDLARARLAHLHVPDGERPLPRLRASLLPLRLASSCTADSTSPSMRRRSRTPTPSTRRRSTGGTRSRSARSSSSSTARGTRRCAGPCGTSRARCTGRSRTRRLRPSGSRRAARCARTPSSAARLVLARQR